MRVEGDGLMGSRAWALFPRELAEWPQALEA